MKLEDVTQSETASRACVPKKQSQAPPRLPFRVDKTTMITPRRGLTLTPSEQASMSEFGRRRQEESLRKKAAEMRVQQRTAVGREAMTRMDAPEVEARMRQQLASSNPAALQWAQGAQAKRIQESPPTHPNRPLHVVSDANAVRKQEAAPPPAGQGQRADTAADTAAEAAAKAVIRSGTYMPRLGEVCERIVQEQKVLGAGAFAMVFQGNIPGLGQVAVKRLGKEGEDVGDFQREVAILQLPEHPNLLRMLGCGKSRDARYLVYPFIGGGDLFGYLGSSHPTIHQHGCRLGIAQDVVAGLQALHAHSPVVLHRDLKPQNVLISMDAAGTPGGRPRALLSDFGLSRFAPELGAAPHLTSAHMVGTRGYVAPEVLLGHYSTASDIYSFGVLLLQCVTGRKAIVPTQGSAGDKHLSAWAREARMRGRNGGLSDPRADFPWHVAEPLVSLGLECCASSAAARPSLDAISSRLAAIARV